VCAQCGNSGGIPKPLRSPRVASLLENATLRSRWKVWEDGLNPSISRMHAGTMQQKGYLVALCSGFAIAQVPVTASCEKVNYFRMSRDTRATRFPIKPLSYIAPMLICVCATRFL